jgi:hypothetical protein
MFAGDESSSGDDSESRKEEASFTGEEQTAEVETAADQAKRLRDKAERATLRANLLKVRVATAEAAEAEARTELAAVNAAAKAAAEAARTAKAAAKAEAQVAAKSAKSALKSSRKSLADPAAYGILPAEVSYRSRNGPEDRASGGPLPQATDPSTVISLFFSW